MSDSQEGNTQEQPSVDELFIKEFAKSSAANLQSYENKNRDRIAEASLTVREAFNEKWKKVIGSPYYQAVTLKPEPALKTERVDPESKGYKGYWEVMFSPKGKPDDPDDVTLSLNGVCLQMQREAPVVIPGPYLEVADHGVYPTYIQLPGKDRKISGRVKFFPYNVLREASKEEYENQKDAGNKITKDAREKAEMA